MSAPSVVQTGDLRMDLSLRRVWLRDTEVMLAPREYGLLAYLAERIGRNCPVIEIVAAVWGEAWAEPIRGVAGGMVPHAHTAMFREACKRLRVRLGAAGSLIVTGPYRTAQPWRRLDAVRVYAMPASHDRQTVLDAALLPPRLRDSMIATYRELAAFDRSEGRHDLADYSTLRADALSYGGRITLGDLP